MCNYTLTDLIVNLFRVHCTRYCICLALLGAVPAANSQEQPNGLPISETPPGWYYATDQAGNQFRFYFPATNDSSPLVYKLPQGEGYPPLDLPAAKKAKQITDNALAKASKPPSPSIMQRIMRANEAARIRHQPTINVNYTIKQLPSGP